MRPGGLIWKYILMAEKGTERTADLPILLPGLQLA
jgi:hypothetical protein